MVRFVIGGMMGTVLGCGFSAPPIAPGDELVAPGDAASTVDQTSDAAVDAAIDPPWNGVCPSNYNTLIYIGGQPVRQYRVISAATSFWALHNDCRDDVGGATHLMVINSSAELAAMISNLKLRATQPPNARYYVGLTQSSTASQPNQGWIGLDGEPPPSGIWDTELGSDQPNDGMDLDENNHQEQVGWIDIDQASGIFDGPGPTAYGAICECDGIPVSATATQYIEADPNNPY